MSSTMVIPARYMIRANAPAEIPDLLQAIFISEMIMPSRCIWLVSPWISNISIINNKANQFVTLDPSWARRTVRFAEVLAKLVETGTTLHIATRPDPHNKDFLRTVSQMTEGFQDRVHFHETSVLHEKGLLGDNYYLSGSMNFTYNGVFVLEESAQFITNPQDIAGITIEFAGRWGDAS